MYFIGCLRSNLASFLYYLQEKEPKAFKRIEMTVGSIVPFFDRFVLRPSRLNEDLIRLEWVEKGFSDLPFSAYHLSDVSIHIAKLQFYLWWEGKIALYSFVLP